MVSRERATLLGEKKLLEDSRKVINVKIESFANSIREQTLLLLIDNYEEIKDESIKVCANELSKLVNELRKNGEKLKKINNALGEDDK